MAMSGSGRVQRCRASRPLEAYQPVMWPGGGVQRRTVSVEYLCARTDYACLRADPGTTRALSRVGSCRVEATKAGSRRVAPPVRVYELAYDGAQRWFHADLVLPPGACNPVVPESPVVDLTAPAFPPPTAATSATSTQACENSGAHSGAAAASALGAPGAAAGPERAQGRAVQIKDLVLSPQQLAATAGPCTREHLLSAALVGFAVGRGEQRGAQGLDGHVRLLFGEACDAAWALATVREAPGSPRAALDALAAALWDRDERLAKALRLGFAHGWLEAAWRARRLAEVAGALERCVAEAPAETAYGEALRAFSRTWRRFYGANDLSSIHTLGDMLMGSL
eukprot:m51a1_g1548 hypothetical protein (339) ;mRNA; r:568404-569799